MKIYNLKGGPIFGGLTFRPHSALDNMTPEEYVKKHLKKPEISNFGWYRLRGEGQTVSSK